MRAFATAVSLLVAACSGGDHAARPLAEPNPAPAAPVRATAHGAPYTCPQVPLHYTSDADDARIADQPGSRIATPPHGDRCAVADSNLARVEAAILRAHDAGGPPGAAVPSKPWDRARPPLYDKLVAHRLALGADEQQHLARDGFVILPRMTFASYAAAFHEIYQSQLPIYISVDAVLHAVYAGNDALIAQVEDDRLAPLLGSTLDVIGCKLADGGFPATQIHDIDVYMAVARALFRGDAPVSMSGDPSVVTEAQGLVAAAVAGAEMRTVSLFGRDRVVDFTAYTPRGHYTATASRQRFFRATTWLSRLELNLVSRGSRSSTPGATPDPRETPREVLDAMLLAYLARTYAPEQLTQLDQAWTLFAGRREDVSPALLAQISANEGILADLSQPDAEARVRAAIGDHYQRTVRMHYMPAGVTELPAIMTFLGARVVTDAQATRPLVSDELPDRSVLHAADMAVVLGHDRARAYLAADRAQFPTLDAQLGRARALLAAAPRGSDDLYSAWFDAIAGLAETPAGARPAFMATPAYADLRVASAIAAYGQLKHAFVLIAGESYFAGGCDIPDGYVEPAPRTYAALRDYAGRGARAMKVLDPVDATGAGAYFQRLDGLLRILDEIAADELAGRPLSADERAFLSMVAEMEPGTTGAAPTFSGWWFDLFHARQQDGLAPAGYLASFFTGTKIAYVGATAPRLGVFVVDTGGPARLVVGPVARPYEYEGAVGRRLDDVAGAALPEAARSEPWAASYTAGAAAPEPALQMIYPAQDTKHRLDVSIETAVDLGPVTIELYDHHRLPLATVTRVIKAGLTYIPVPPRLLDRTEGIHLRVGAYRGWFDRDVMEGSIYASLGPAPAP